MLVADCRRLYTGLISGWTADSFITWRSNGIRKDTERCDSRMGGEGEE
jgi:hypothetical protein